MYQTDPVNVALLRFWGRSDVVLMDLCVASAAQVREMAVHARTVVLHRVGQELQMLEALRASALWHLEKPDRPPAQAVAAVRAVSRGGSSMKSFRG